MTDLFQPDRHVPLVQRIWSEAEARGAIAEIVSDALAHFDPEKFWPSHPLDGVPGGVGGIYFGAAGVISALEHLRRAGAVEYQHDFLAVLPSLVACDNALIEKTLHGKHGSFLLGDLGALLVAMRLQPNAETSDRVHARAAVNDDLPVLELMWGTPGSMLSCVFMDEMTGDPRFEALYRKQAARLLADLQDAEGYRIWTQELYGQRVRYLGLVHGFAGNMFALLRAWSWLSPAQQETVAVVSKQTLAATAQRSGSDANWPAKTDEPDAPMLCQICHGAPGIVAAFAGAPFAAPEFDALLAEGAALTWNAGPLAKGSNLCHGTAGNGYAFLKLYKRTGDALWLDRARAFAMAAIAQLRAERQQYGQGRYSLWTGDPGVAVYLWDCIRADAAFPTLDII